MVKMEGRGGGEGRGGVGARVGVGGIYERRRKLE